MFSPTKIRTYSGDALRIEDPNSNITSFYVGTNGKTVIGKPLQATSPHTNAVLTVNGKAVTKEVIVTQQLWADYVFSKDYKLNSLTELELYIKETKHLPNIPSEKEIIEQGLNVGEMQKLQMEKIEELTLYIIQLKKELEEIKKQFKK
jgi:hypothetical protein